jgi:8-oxo-dGTP pyrophosphatase MutT (NUDIX family)
MFDAPPGRHAGARTIPALAREHGGSPQTARGARYNVGLMETARWHPHITVAALIERDGRFLCVEEDTPQGLRLNQPAGHLEPGETLAQAVGREALEETARPFTPQALVGVYLTELGQRPGERTYLRFAFSGMAGAPVPGRALDTGIVRTLWLSRAELAAAADRLRTPLALRCVDDYLAGRRFPLNVIHASGVG